MSCLSDRLIELRQEKRISQREAGEKIGIKPTTYSMWERGNNTPDIYTICKLANMFEVSTDYILGNSDYKDPTGANDSEALKTALNNASASEKNAAMDLLKEVRELILSTLSDKHAEGKLNACITAVKAISEYNSALNKNLLDGSIDGYISVRSEADKQISSALDTLARTEDGR